MPVDAAPRAIKISRQPIFPKKDVLAVTRLQNGALVYVTVGDAPIEQYL
jgi:hypothetical protein